MNFKFFFNIIIYFLSVQVFEFIFVIGVYYLIQDYFFITLNYFSSFQLLGIKMKENLKFSFILILFFSFLF